MSTGSLDTLGNVLSTGVIIAIVIGSIVGLALCIGSIVIVIFIIKHCNRSRYPRTHGVILQPQLYPHSWDTHYPPDITSVANYPPPYQPGLPPYTTSNSDYVKPPYT